MMLKDIIPIKYKVTIKEVIKNLMENLPKDIDLML